jgi:hypothetical protein
MLLGALICAVGGFWAAVKQSELREASKAQTELLRDIAARSGDKKELEELIKARSRVLNADRGKADSVADGILKRLPDLTNEFNAMQENKRSDFENRTADFRLKPSLPVDRQLGQARSKMFAPRLGSEKLWA